jgi:predicted restriction endonuclease
MYVSKSKQNAIRQLVPDRLAKALAARGVRLAPASAEPGALPDSPSIRGGQRHSLVAVREGQAAFRRALIRRYGQICAVSGPTPVEALEAAHLRAFAQFKEHRVEDGMLLRADIHRLFDRGLIAVDPNTMTICVSPSLAGYPEYATIHGQRLAIPATHYPSPVSLAAHYQQSPASW